MLEISDMMFTTSGNTAGAVLMEWNVHEDQQGSAAMWDVIIRVGGAKGTDLTVEKCLWTREFQKNDHCMAGSMMLHVTSDASIYMENMWFWVAGLYFIEHLVSLAYRKQIMISMTPSKHGSMSMWGEES
jgi:hypothetical protein